MNAKAIMKYFSLMIAVFSISVSISGCSMLPNFGNLSGKKGLDSSTYKNAQPSDFEGPYADRFATIIQTYANDFVYSIIKDSKITAEGYNLSQETFKQCVNDAGYGVHFENDTYLRGAYIVENVKNIKDASVPVAIDDLVNNCETKSGYPRISELYYTMLVNPQRTDMNDNIAQCLIKFKYEENGYTGEDYLKDTKGIKVYPSGYGDKNTMPGSDNEVYDKKTKKQVPGLNYLKCENDPIGMLSQK
jgi:hypothetical protein